MATNRKRRKENGNVGGIGLRHGLTPAQFCAYAKDHGVEITPNALALLRRDGKGPPYFLINGRWILYIPRSADRFIEDRQPRLVDPADRMNSGAT